MRILFLFPYPETCAASQRFRFEQYLKILEEEGYEVVTSPFLDFGTWQILYKKGRWTRKFIGLLKGYIRRLSLLFRVGDFDYVFVHREAEAIGPPLIECALARILKKKIIYDLDDAVWIPNSSEHNRFFAMLKWHSNAFAVARMAYRISAGNDFLADKMREFNKDVLVNPTTIDTEDHHNVLQSHENDIPVIGWTGTHSTLQYLDALFPVIRELKGEKDFEFIIISDNPPARDNDLFEFVQWNKESEIPDLMRMNIGLMPLDQDEWSMGKCGFKALQYMSLGIPALVSPVGVNESIVSDGINGFICRTEKDWKQAILFLLNNREACRSMGKAARKKIEAAYSVQSNRANFLHLFS